MPSAAGTVITAEATAKTLEELIQTALGDTTWKLPTGLDVLNALYAQVLTNGIKYLSDGNVPTTDIGYVAFAVDSVNLEGVDLSKVKIIREGASDAKMAIQLARVYTRA